MPGASRDFIAIATVLSLSLPSALVAQTARVAIGKAANQLSVSTYEDSAVVALSGPVPEGGGIATARLAAALPEARTWATAALAAVSSCRADKTRLQHATTLYDHLARNDTGEGRFPSAIFSCRRGRRGELATIDVAMTTNFATSLLFTSYSDAQAYFQRVVKALPPSGSTTLQGTFTRTKAARHAASHECQQGEGDSLLLATKTVAIAAKWLFKTSLPNRV